MAEVIEIPRWTMEHERQWRLMVAHANQWRTAVVSIVSEKITMVRIITPGVGTKHFELHDMSLKAAMDFAETELVKQIREEIAIIGELLKRVVPGISARMAVDEAKAAGLTQPKALRIPKSEARRRTAVDRAKEMAAR